MTKISITRRLILLLLPVAILFSSCKDQLDLTADYKDITISYGIINVQDPVHYFKIYKGYLTDENALVQASDWNSIYYPVDSIEVRLEEYSGNGALTFSDILDTTTVIPKDEGYFANPGQLLYYSARQLDPEKKYRLVIKRLSTGKEIYAETLLVGTCKMTRPIDQNPFNSKDNNGPKFLVTGEGSASAKDMHAAICDFYLTFHYLEIDKTTGERSHKTLSRKMNSSYRTPKSDGDIDFDGFKPTTLLHFLAEHIQENANVTRYIDSVDGLPYFCLEIEAWLANDHFQIYQQVANPNTSIVQNRLEYTNFVSDDSDAYGLLASRSSVRRLFKFDNTNGKYNEDSLVWGSITGKLNFDYYRNSPEFVDLSHE